MTVAEQKPHAETQDAAPLPQQLAEKTAEAARLRKANAELIFIRSDLEARLRSARAAQETEAGKLGKAEQDLQKATERLRTLESDTASKEARIERMQSMVQILRSDLEREFLQRRALSEQLEESERQRAALEEETGAQHHEIDGLRREHADLSLRLQDTERWLQGILTSKSHRLMAPARRLRVLFRRG